MLFLPSALYLIAASSSLNLILVVEIIANDQGNRTTPSYVSFTEEERLIGDSAKNVSAMNPTNTVFDAKRLIGRRFDDPDVKKDMKVSKRPVFCAKR